MKVRIEVEPQAITQLAELDDWWREQRPDSRTTVLDEFEHALEAALEHPDRGTLYTRDGVRNVRWLSLRDTPYLLYYHHEPGGDVLSVVAVWSGMRGVGPSLVGR